MPIRNQKLIKILIILVSLSVLFASYAVYVWWHGTKPIEVEQAKTNLLNFSDVFQVADSTRDYAHGAIVIADIESDPDFKKLFLTDPPPLPNETTILYELAKVDDYMKRRTEQSAAQVLETSYYIGNFEVLPEKTLQSWLYTSNRIQTTKLLETALADIRSGVVTIQDVYDVAPPYLYAPLATSSRVYFDTPSFPSLTMSEVAITALIMAKIDSANARFYELQAQKYADSVYASGANFEVDVHYAMKLAELYFLKMEESTTYQALFAAAAEEWGTDVFVASNAIIPESYPVFTFSRFPIQDKVGVSDVMNYDYRTSYSEDEIAGSLRLSLVDTRLPEPSMRLYEFNLQQASTAQVVPIALSLQQGIAGKARQVLAFAEYSQSDPNSFYFFTGKKGMHGKIFEAGSVEIQKVENNEVSSVLTVGSLFDHILDREQVFYNDQDVFVENQHADGRSDIVRISLAAQSQNPVIFATGTSPTVAFENTLVFVGGDQSIQARDITSTKQIVVDGVSVPERPNSKRQLRYVAQHTMLIVTDTWVDAAAVPHSMIALYTLSRAGEALVAEPRFKFTTSDMVVTSTTLSPGGRYVAFNALETLGKRNPKVLIFDTFDGIIKKEVDLRSFTATSVSIDDWISK